jgi:hypothetical protein
MHYKISGALLLGFAGLVTVIGTAGAQIAYAIVLSGFYAGGRTGEVPPGPQGAVIHWLVIVIASVLAVLGLYYLLRLEKS